jgi:hypothetical protein
MYEVGDIFKINQKEYRIRVFNEPDMYWLEPVLKRDKSFCVTGGNNKIIYHKELMFYEYLNICYR